MFSLGALGFINPLLLTGLIALPVLWWLLRAIPPSPKLQIFAGVRLLLGLEDPERAAAKTPWWLLLLRCLALAAVIIGFAGPVLNPGARLAPQGEGPVLILLDQGWASAPDWPARKAAALAALDEAARENRQVVLWPTASGGVPPVLAAAAARAVLEASEPLPWAPDRAGVLAALEAGAVPEPAQTVWFHDGLAHDDPSGDGRAGGEATAALAARLAAAGPLRLVGPVAPARALTPPRLEDGHVVAEVLRADADAPAAIAVVAYSAAPGEPERRLGVTPASFAAGARSAAARFDLPPELLERISRISLAEGASAGGVAIADSALRRVTAAIVDLQAEVATASLTSASHFLRQALTPWADVRTAALGDLLADPPPVIVLADQGDFTDPERDALTGWVEQGGLLIRFAGPRLAAAVGEGGLGTGAVAEDRLLPVRLRRGGRVLGGALAWGAPKALGPFDPEGPFRRLVAPAEVDVRTQVLAEPSPDLAGRVWAVLEDGTPLVTAARRGRGHVVLFHVSADAEWSSLPLSGLFVEMLGRLIALAPGRVPEPPGAEELAGTLWRGALMTGWDGRPVPAPELAEPVPGERLAEARAGRLLPPGLYRRVDAAVRPPGAAETVVVNLFRPGDGLAPFPPAPAGAVVETLGGLETHRLGPALVALAVALGAIDLLATVWLSGRLTTRRRRATAAAAGLLAAMLAPPGARAGMPVERMVAAAAETTLGYILTGDSRTDEISERAMVGLGNALAARTAVEPGPPMGVDPAEDELSLFPVLYWPLSQASLPDPATLERLSRYLSGGGMLLIDTQSGAAGLGAAAGVDMRQVARALNLPALAPVDTDHVLSRSFYLLSSFPGRWRGGQVWAEVPPPGGEHRGAEPDLPQFDRVDDNVSPVVVGSADWAAAWAVDEGGRPMFPVGRAGDNQREMAIRFGINVVMYALTGNYKSDQVHAPAVLERLGQ